jgi:pyruvate dehydrogenase E2 component (dihydrolipoamide acetyltransferase)
MSTTVFRLPDIGEGLAEAEIVEWLVAAGAEVRADQPVVTVETAKAQVELPAPADGVITELAHGPGDIVPVGSALFTFEATGSGAGAVEPAPASEPALATAPAVDGRAVPASPARAGAGRRRVLAAPSTRRLAVEHGIELAELTGSGPNGRIVLDDVRAAMAGGARSVDGAAPRSPEPVTAQAAVTPATTPAEPVAGETQVRPLRGLRRQVARAMTAAWSVPHITEFREVDATELERAHRTLRADAEEQGLRLTLLPLLVRAVTTALRRHPDFNATLDMEREEVTLHRRLDVGIAAATPDGLIVPVLRDAGRRSVPGLAREIARLGAGARERSLPLQDTTGGTFTISNFGSYGTWLGTPLINAPQVAIAGFGRVHDAVVPVDGVPAVRRVLPLAVAADHRLIDGEHLGAFVNTLERLIRTPLLLLGEED